MINALTDEICRHFLAALGTPSFFNRWIVVVQALHIKRFCHQVVHRSHFPISGREVALSDLENRATFLQPIAAVMAMIGYSHRKGAVMETNLASAIVAASTSMVTGM